MVMDPNHAKIKGARQSTVSLLNVTVRVRDLTSKLFKLRDPTFEF